MQTLFSTLCSTVKSLCQIMAASVNRCCARVRADDKIGR
jgi:hypothetical protein